MSIYAKPSQTTGRQVLARRGTLQKQAPINYRGTSVPGQPPPAAAPGAPRPGAGMFGAANQAATIRDQGRRPPPMTPGAGPGLPAQPAASNQANPNYRPFSADAQKWSQMQAGQRAPAAGLLPMALPAGAVTATGPGAGDRGVRPAPSGMMGGQPAPTFGAAGLPGAGITAPADVAGIVASRNARAGGLPGDAITNLPAGSYDPNAADYQTTSRTGDAGLAAGALDGTGLGATTTRQQYNPADRDILTAQDAVLTAQDPNAGKQAVPNPIGPQASIAGDIIDKVEQTAGDIGEVFNGTNPVVNSYSPTNPTPAAGGSGGDGGSATGTEASTDGTRLDPEHQTAIDAALSASGIKTTTDSPNKDGSWQDEAYAFGKEGLGIPAAAAAGAAETLNKYGKESVEDFYKDENGVAYGDLDPLKNAGENLMSDDYWDASESANQQLLNSNVTGERNAQMRQALGMSGRGGQLGAGTIQGIYGNADKAMSEGQLKLMADAAQRRLAGTQAGAGIYGGAIGQQYGLMQDAYTPTSETFAALTEMFPEIMDALNPMPFT